ncbi:hypothetical protein HXV88_02290 [Aeromonas veronii]|uniref:hypothetical protein n=1 Tax=Aeromonas veronii TaxID=654 RepID=UPI0015CF8DA0|nr:hypothetical protein [Aeromonas veronii]QLH65358.1 hypothetical protein HXV88_02290 [Aeromonas veronii]
MTFKPSCKSKAPVATAVAKPLVIIGRNLVNLTHIAYTKRYQPLNVPLEEMTPEAIARLGIGINSLERQIAFDATAESEKQIQLLKDVRDALANEGLLEKYFVLEDGTIVLPELVKSADYGEMNLGHVVRLYADGIEKPIMTCLCSSEAACVHLLTELSNRLNGSSTQ